MTRGTHSLRSLLLVATLSASGCGGALFKVKPFVELPPLPEASKSAVAGGLTLRVAPLLRDEESQALFEANLPLAGVLPVRLEMANDGEAPIDLKRARVRLYDAEGREWKLLSTKKAASRILKANNVFVYNPHSRKQFEKEFGAYGIDLKTPLSGTEGRQGFLFFQTPNKEPVASPRGLRLSIERLPQPFDIEL